VTHIFGRWNAAMEYGGRAMVQTNWLTPFAQIGRELRIELRMSWQGSRLASLAPGSRKQDIPLLPEQRIVDDHIVAQHKAELFLQSVRHGAVRR
jgi:hypothetical protein